VKKIARGAFRKGGEHEVSEMGQGARAAASICRYSGVQTVRKISSTASRTRSVSEAEAVSDERVREGQFTVAAELLE
jgi:hypothetical protein